MKPNKTRDSERLPAGGFSSWLRGMRQCLDRGSGMDVPCGGCQACCTSAYFILVQPDEKETLARIPRKYLSPAPGLPKGNLLVGYYENGRCPLLAAGGCSIYEHRPRTCRTFDCRIFAAAGIAAGGPDKAMITGQARRWAFAYPTPEDRRRHRAVRAAARFLARHADRLPAGWAAGNPSQLALLAVKLHRFFLAPESAAGRLRRLTAAVRRLPRRSS